MKTKKNWQQPTIQEIHIDNEISILMTSTPPGDPFKSAMNETEDTGQNDPYA